MLPAAPDDLILIPTSEPVPPRISNRAVGAVLPIPTDPEKSADPVTDNIFAGDESAIPNLPSDV